MSRVRRDEPDRQPKNPVTVTHKKRRTFTVKDADSFLRGEYTESTSPTPALTDDKARFDIIALERAIERHYGGEASAKGAYGRYGSKYSSGSINNPYGQYGSKYSNDSARNPYAPNAPIIIGDD